MKTIFVGGGHGCRAVLEMVVNKRLAEFRPEVVGVIDPNPNAPGILYAQAQGWSTFSRLEDALHFEGLELIVEVTGIDEVREEIVRLVPESVRIMDHSMARVFWDLEEMARSLREELKQKTKLETEIREDRLRLQELLDSLPDSVLVLDENQRVIRTNRRFQEITGISRSAALGKQCRDLFCNGKRNDSDHENCPAERVLKTDQALTVVQKNCCIQSSSPSGEEFYQITANPISSTEGNTHVVITSREITNQIRLARETEEQARRARQILKTVRGIITMTDLKGRHNFANPSAEKFYGLSADVFSGKTMADIFPPELSKVVEKNDNEICKNGGLLSHEEVLVLNNHEYILITERILLYDYKHEPVGICRVSHNITNSRRLQQELLESERHAAVGKLAAGVAHELNNPLTGILSFSEDLLEDIDSDSPIHEDLQIILHETMRCRQIVRDLLDFSRQTKTELQVVSIPTIVARAIKLVEKQPSFHDVQFDASMGDELLRVHADPNKLQQIILNLITNARDSMEGKGNIVVAAKELAEKEGVTLIVTDDGCGIPEENLDRIFEPFFSTKGDRGNGLGLAAIKSIVEEHQGTVKVESEKGKGTAFFVTLPAAHSLGKLATSRSPSSFPSYHDWAEE